MLKICPVCSNEFETRLRHKKYCGDECRRRFSNSELNVRRQQYVKEFLAENPINCKGCGIEFIRTNGSQIYHSPECRAEFHEKHRVDCYVPLTLSPEETAKVKTYIEMLRS